MQVTQYEFFIAPNPIVSKYQFLVLEQNHSQSVFVVLQDRTERGLLFLEQT